MWILPIKLGVPNFENVEILQTDFVQVVSKNKNTVTQKRPITLQTMAVP